MKLAKLKVAVFLYLAGMLAIHAVVFWNVRGLVAKGYSDFAIYYGAGLTVRHGLGHQLYDPATQFKMQKEFASGVAIRAGALPYNHPPCEAVFFAPLTYFSYPVAFTLWGMANLGMIIASQFFLRPHLPQLQGYPWPLWVVASLAFTPIFWALLQGQDSILLLLLYTLAYLCLRRKQDVLAGGWLALGLFKPQLVLPFVLVLLIQGKKKLLYGFVPVAAGLILVSIAIVGMEGFISYPHYVFHMEQAIARTVVPPSDMPNLRGLLDMLLHDRSYSVWALAAGSLGILVLTLWRTREVGSRDFFDLQFSLTVVATVLVSYHALAHDLSILALPIALLLNDLQSSRVESYIWPRALTIVAIALFLSPLQLILAMRFGRLALLSWVVLCLLVGISGLIGAQHARQWAANHK